MRSKPFRSRERTRSARGLPATGSGLDKDPSAPKDNRMRPFFRALVDELHEVPPITVFSSDLIIEIPQVGSA